MTTSERKALLRSSSDLNSSLICEVLQIGTKSLRLSPAVGWGGERADVTWDGRGLDERTGGVAGLCPLQWHES